MQYKINLADAVKWAKKYKGEPFHALLTDAPYELGFMGKDWDKSGVAFDPKTWSAFLGTMHPGAFGMSFASSRGWHRLAAAIEDGGFIIHPSIFGWLFGSGFPKATRTERQERCKTCNGIGVVKEKYYFDKRKEAWQATWQTFGEAPRPCLLPCDPAAAACRVCATASVQSICRRGV